MPGLKAEKHACKCRYVADNRWHARKTLPSPGPGSDARRGEEAAKSSAIGWGCSQGKRNTFLREESRCVTSPIWRRCRVSRPRSPSPSISRKSVRPALSRVPSIISSLSICDDKPRGEKRFPPRSICCVLGPDRRSSVRLISSLRRAPGDRAMAQDRGPDRQSFGEHFRISPVGDAAADWGRPWPTWFIRGGGRGAHGSVFTRKRWEGAFQG